MPMNETESSIDSDSDQSKQHPKCLRQDQIIKLLICFCFIGWVCVACVVLSMGRPSQLLLPTNSKGETCGLDNQYGKPYLLYLDITLCAGLNAAESGCSSPTVCVEYCPNTHWTSAQGNSSGLEQFCDNLSGRPEADLSQLVEEGLRPAYLLPSKSVMGRCLTRLKDIKIHETKLNEMKTYNQEILNATKLKEGIEYVTDSFNNLGFDLKLHIYMSLYWWNVPIFLVLSSLIWTLVALICHYWSRIPHDYAKQTKVHTDKFNIGVKLISEQNKTTLLFPILPFFAQVVLLFWPLAVSTSLSSIGSPQFRVVNACSTETCINTNSEKTFRQDDFCEPDIFSKCTGCPRAQCVFHKFEHCSSRYFLHGYNFVVMIWLLILLTGSRDLSELKSFLTCFRSGYDKTNLQEVELKRLDKQVEIHIVKSGEDGLEQQGTEAKTNVEGNFAINHYISPVRIINDKLEVEIYMDRSGEDELEHPDNQVPRKVERKFAINAHVYHPQKSTNKNRGTDINIY